MIRLQPGGPDHRADVPLKIETQPWRRLDHGRGAAWLCIGIGGDLVVARPGIEQIELPYPSNEFRVVDMEDASVELPPGEPGELMYRGPLVMMGYHGNASATAETVRPDGWLHTGDVDVMDEDYVTIVDRKKDMILTAGFNVYPAELERVLCMHPAVALAAVGSVPDEAKGELAKAYVILKPDVEVSGAALIAFCRDHLAAYKLPRAVQFVRAVPMTASGKIMRRLLNP